MNNSESTCAICGKKDSKGKARIGFLDRVIFQIDGPLAHNNCLTAHVVNLNLKSMYPEAIAC